MRLTRRYPTGNKLKIAWAIISIVLGPIILAVVGILLYTLFKCVTESPIESLTVFGLMVLLGAFFWAWDTIAYYDERNN